MNEQRKVSIIVPIYNGERYLSQCVDSLIKQTYHHIEIILINDGSKDSSLEICNRYAKEDARCIVVDKENGGVTNARKAGVNASTGEFIYFADCDDWLDGNAIEKLMDEVNKHQADIVISGYVNELGENISEKKYGNLEEGVYSKASQKELHSKIFYQGCIKGWGIWPTLWAKLFKKDFIAESLEELDERIFYGEDAACLFPACFKAERLVVIKNAGYHYRTFSETSVSAKRNKNLLDNMFYLHEYLYALFQKQENNEELLNQLRYYMVSLMNHAGTLLFHIPYHLQEIEWVKPQVTEWQKKYFDLLNRQDNEEDGELSHEMEKIGWLFPYYAIEDARRIVLYGAGNVGKSYYSQIRDSDALELTAWVDRYVDKENNIIAAKDITEYNYDRVVIAISNIRLINEVIEELVTIGVEREKIIWVKPVKLKNWYIKNE